jgi:acetyl esterase/lipase
MDERPPQPRWESRFCQGHSTTVRLWPEPQGASEQVSFHAALFRFPALTPVVLPATILVVPGGGLKSYTKHEGQVAAKYFASLGYPTYVLLYRHEAVGGNASDAHQDTRRAIACLRRREGKHVHAIGFSAGGTLITGACGRHDDDGGDEPPAESRPDSASYIYGAPPPGLALGPCAPPMFVFGTAGDRLCDTATCHTALLSMLTAAGVRHAAVLWPNVWNDDEELHVLTRKHARWACDHQHGQGIGILLGKYPKQELVLWGWVAQLETWLREQLIPLPGTQVPGCTPRER